MPTRQLMLANYVLLIWLGLGCLLIAQPESLGTPFRRTLRDLCTPGLNLCGRLTESLEQLSTGVDSSTEITGIESRDTAEVVRLQRELITTKELLAQAQRPQWNAEATARLFEPKLIAARRLLPDQEARWKQAVWLNVGRRQQIREQDWVLKADSPLIDIGGDFRLQPDQLLLAGRQIIGQIDQVGLWSSTYRPLTDDGFRCPAVVMHRQTGLREENMAGSLHGRGELLADLHYIENTHPVSPGDYVVMADPQRRFAFPLLLGIVASANVVADSPFWQIEVKLPEVASDASTVHVIVEQLNAVRLQVPSPASTADDPRAAQEPNRASAGESLR